MGTLQASLYLCFCWLWASAVFRVLTCGEAKAWNILSITLTGIKKYFIFSWVYPQGLTITLTFTLFEWIYRVWQFKRLSWNMVGRLLRYEPKISCVRDFYFFYWFHTMAFKVMHVGKCLTSRFVDRKISKQPSGISEKHHIFLKINAC